MVHVSRKEWGARTPRSMSIAQWSQRSEFIVHHSAGPHSQTVRSIQDYHMDGNGWSDIGYNFLVDHKGTTYTGRGWMAVGAHAPNHNTSGIGVCFIGNNNPTEAGMRAIKALYDEACRLAERKLKILGHGDVYPTDCPGSHLQEWVDKGLPMKEDLVSGLPTLKPGDEGFDVKTIRWLLGARGYPPNDLYSFRFDEELGEKVREFKKAKGLPNDMVWGENSWKAALRISE